MSTDFFNEAVERIERATDPRLSATDTDVLIALTYAVLALVEKIQ